MDAPAPVSNTLPAPDSPESPLSLLHIWGWGVPAREGSCHQPFTEHRTLLCLQTQPPHQTPPRGQLTVLPVLLASSGGHPS